MTDLDNDIEFDIDMVGLFAARAEIAATTQLGMAGMVDIPQGRADLELWAALLNITYADARNLLDTWPEEDRAAQLLNDWKAA
jgi:hypothetical protein